MQIRLYAAGTGWQCAVDSEVLGSGSTPTLARQAAVRAIRRIHLDYIRQGSPRTVRVETARIYSVLKD